MATNPITSTVDFERDGNQHGWLELPYSRDDSAWGAVMIPIAVVKNGRGPTALLTGGNHGDEYEGPIALLKLARSLEPGAISGRVIIIPALNYPAVMAGTRVSPIDGVNMNRAFPGLRDGSVTQMIADYLQRTILPLSDALVDIHSGGKTMMFSPFSAYHKLPDAALQERCRAGAAAFGAPITLELVELDAAGMLDTAVEELGKVFVGTELGGGGTATTETVAIAERGIQNMLAHFGLTERTAGATAPDTRPLHMPEPGCFLIAEHGGLYEPLADLGTTVASGQAVGQIHHPDEPSREPVAYHAKTAGLVIGRSHKVLVVPGDFLGLIAHDMP